MSVATKVLEKVGMAAGELAFEYIKARLAAGADRKKAIATAKAKLDSLERFDAKTEAAFRARKKKIAKKR